MSVGVTFGSAIPLICGAQVGTCITSILSSLGASNNGKRTALLNLYYNLFKTLPFLLIFYLLNSFIHFSFLNDPVGVIGIPIAHITINLIASAVYLPLSGIIVRLAERTIPMSEEEKEAKTNSLTILDPILLSNPSFALKQADIAVSSLADTVSRAFALITREEISQMSTQLTLRHIQRSHEIRALPVPPQRYSDIKRRDVKNDSSFFTSPFLHLQPYRRSNFRFSLL